MKCVRGEIWSILFPIRISITCYNTYTPVILLSKSETANNYIKFKTFNGKFSYETLERANRIDFTHGSPPHRLWRYLVREQWIISRYISYRSWMAMMSLMGPLSVAWRGREWVDDDPLTGESREIDFRETSPS